LILLGDLTPPPKRVPICKMMQISESLDVADQKILAHALANTEDWPTESLTRELKKRGIDVGRETVRAHRRGDCVCVSQ